MASKNSQAKMIGDYQIKGRPLGSGGMATVHLVTKDNKEFAAKVLHKHLMRERKTVERFKQEYNIGTSMKRSPAFVKMIDLFKDDGCWIIIMEYVPGCTVHDLLNKFGRLSPKEAIAITYELAEALTPFHAKNYIHRDLKPCNLMLTPAGQVKIMDYGVTRDLGANITKTGTTIGTPLYMAPEQICGSKKIDGRSDIYSLGLILYRLVTRKDAHGMTNSFEFIDLVETRMKKDVKEIKNFEDKELLDFIKKSLTPKPENRIPNTKEFCELLNKLTNYSTSRKKLIKNLLISMEKNIQAKKDARKQAKIEKTIVQPKTPVNIQTKLKKWSLIAGLSACAASGAAIYFMGWSKFFDVIKSLFN